jgi:adenine-specific DNA-methyltransferase
MAKDNKKSIETLIHKDAYRRNIPTAEYQSVMHQEEQSPIRVAYERRNRDLDPQLVWRGKDKQDWSDLVVQAPPLYIQEKVHPKVLIDDLMRETRKKEGAGQPRQLNLFADFNGLPSEGAKTEFYQHDANWSNRMILGDSLQVMASLAEREGLRGQVQCIYIDPPYGIKFNSNFQWSTTSRDVKDGSPEHITREPEQVKAFRDTWRDGIHSYLTYLRDRLTVARDLLTESGSIFVQIGDENVHRVRALMDEIFGDDKFISSIWFKKNAFSASNYLSNVFDNILWYSKTNSLKVRPIFGKRTFENSDTQFFDSLQLEDGSRRQLSHEERRFSVTLPAGSKVFARNPMTSAGLSKTSSSPVLFKGRNYPCAPNSHWKTTPDGLERLLKADRIVEKGTRIRMVRFIEDNSTVPMSNLWSDTGVGGFVGDDKVYIVQTDSRAVERCILMTTDPGDLVLDPTCGSGTTVYVAEQWGRRWITIDTSRVALALARARIMGARYPYYLLADSRDGQIKEAEITRKAPSQAPTHGNIRQGFVYERVPHITLKSIANNAEIDVIWEKYQDVLEPLRERLNKILGKAWEEWEIPREPDNKWSKGAREFHSEWWNHRIGRQKEIDASIAAKADFEYLHDKPCEDKKKVRVSGPFTVESLSPHRVLGVDENDELIDGVSESEAGFGDERDFVRMILENLKTSGVQQAHKEDKMAHRQLT